MTLGNLFGIGGLRAMTYDLVKCTARWQYLMPASADFEIAANDPVCDGIAVVRVDFPRRES